MSSLLRGYPSVAFASPQSFSQFFAYYQIVFASFCGFVGLCFVVTAFVVCMRRFVWSDPEEEERKPLALKAQDRLDAAQWSIKSTVHLLISLVAFGLSGAAVCSPVVKSPDGTNFYYLTRCRGDVCQTWENYYFQTCMTPSSSTVQTFGQQGGGGISRLALSFGASGGGVHVLIIMIELFRRCCPDLCLGYDPDGDLGNPSKGYFPRWILLLLRITAFEFHFVGVLLTAFYIFFPISSCEGGRFGYVYLLDDGGSFGYSFFGLCIALALDFVDICLDGIMGEVGRLVVLEPEDETALKEIVAPSPATILPPIHIKTNDATDTNKVHKNDDGSETVHISVPLPLPHVPEIHPKNPSADDDAKKVIQEQQIAMEKLKNEMREQQEKFMLTLQQKNLQQKQQEQHSSSFVPTAQPDTSSHQNSGVDPHQQHDHQHDAELVEQQKQILALRQLVEQLQHQHDVVNNNSTTVVTTIVDPNPPLPHQTDDSQTMRQTTPPQDSSPLRPLNTDNKINPLASAPPAAANDNEDSGHVDTGSEGHETTDKKKKHDKSSKSVRKHHDNAPDSAAESRREKFEAQQRMIQKLKDEQQALIDKLQADGGNDQNNNDAQADQDDNQ